MLGTGRKMVNDTFWHGLHGTAARPLMFLDKDENIIEF